MIVMGSLVRIVQQTVTIKLITQGEQKNPAKPLWAICVLSLALASTVPLIRYDGPQKSSIAMYVSAIAPTMP